MLKLTFLALIPLWFVAVRVILLLVCSVPNEELEDLRRSPFIVALVSGVELFRVEGRDDVESFSRPFVADVDVLPRDVIIREIGSDDVALWADDVGEGVIIDEREGEASGRNVIPVTWRQNWG